VQVVSDVTRPALIQTWNLPPTPTGYLLGGNKNVRLLCVRLWIF